MKNEKGSEVILVSESTTSHSQHMSVPHFSFIIVNYRSAARLPGAIASIRQVFTPGEIEIIVVNNDAREISDTNALAATDVSIIQAAENAGFARASNFGARTAQGEILVFLNPDATLSSGNWQALMAVFTAQPQALIGLRLMTPTGVSEAWCAGKRPTLGRLLLNQLPSLTQRVWESNQLRRVDWVSGAALTLRRETFETLGGFDESFFLYFEDVDLCVRAGAKGYPVFRYPFISVEHVGGGSHISSGTLKEAYYEGQRSYFAKHASWLEQWLLRFLLAIFRFFSSLCCSRRSR